MKNRIFNKILCIAMLLVLSISLASCKKTKLTDFQQLVNNVYASEEKLAGYYETSQMKDDELIVYDKVTNFKIQRGEKVTSQIEITEKKLSTSGEYMYDETHTSFTTIDNTKYTVVDGTTYENPYDIPKYYLTFVLTEEFLESGYELTRNEDDFTLKGKVIDNQISSLFLNKSLGNVKNLNIEILMKNKKLQSFNCKYLSENGFDVEIKTEYVYAEKGHGKAIFHLEGGICQNSTREIAYLYPFNGTMLDTLIVDPNVLEEDEKDRIIKNGYHIEGWYKTRIENPDGSITYKDKWDFSKDRMDFNGVELYANWEVNRYYSYELYYTNEAGEAIKLGGYQVNEGQKFNLDFINNSTVPGYTSIGLLDEAGNKWDTNFTHPGGDADVAIKVFLNLIEGEYTVVSTKREFNLAISRNQDIYLINDIDFGGSELAFDSYKGTIEGNNHKISNYEIGYSSSKSDLKGEISDLNNTTKDYLYISLFFKLEDTTIRNLTFEDMIVEVKTSFTMIKHIVVAPLAITASNTHLENVSISGKIVVTKTPECEEIYINKDFWYNKNTDVTVDDSCKVNVTIE